MQANFAVDLQALDLQSDVYFCIKIFNYRCMETFCSFSRSHALIEDFLKI